MRERKASKEGFPEHIRIDVGVNYEKVLLENLNQRSEELRKKKEK